MKAECFLEQDVKQCWQDESCFQSALAKCPCAFLADLDVFKGLRILKMHGACPLGALPLAETWQESHHLLRGGEGSADIGVFQMRFPGSGSVFVAFVLNTQFGNGEAKKRQPLNPSSLETRTKHRGQQRRQIHKYIFNTFIETLPYARAHSLSPGRYKAGRWAKTDFWEPSTSLSKRDHCVQGVIEINGECLH